MVRAVVTFLAQLIILSFIISIEGAAGLPLLFFMMALLLVSSLENVQQTLLTLGGSLILAVVYHLSFSVSALVMLALMWSFPLLARQIKSETLRLGLVSSVGMLIVGMLMRYPWGVGAVVYHGVILGLGLGLFRVLVLRRRQAPSKLMQSAWSRLLHLNQE